MTNEALVLRYNTVLNKSDVNLSYHEELWDSFVSSLEQPAIRSTKDGPAFVPARFRPGGKRKNSDGVSHTAIVLDLDNKAGTLTRLQVEEKLAGWLYAAHTTHSSTREHSKWRIILPLDREMSQQDYEETYEFFTTIFGDAMDKSCVDIARLFFLPACKTPEDYETWVSQGRIFTSNDIFNDASRELVPIKKERLKKEQAFHIIDEIPDGEIHTTFMRIAGWMHAFGLPEAMILAALKAAPTEVQVSPGHVDHIVKEIRKKPRGNLDIKIYDFNNEHAIITLNGDTKVLREEMDPVLKVPKLSFFAPNSFLQAYAYQAEETRAWFSSPKARRYNGLVFDPSDRTGSEYYNLWRGFSCVPGPGDCSRYLAHIRDNVCDGDAALNDWLISWMAAIVQEPAKLYGTAVVLRGGQGTGKTTACKLFGKLFGEHFVQIANKGQLVGNFNGLLLGKIVVLAEDAHGYAGDHQAINRMKALVTEDTMNFEEKYMKPVTVQSCIHLMMCSNESWVVSTGADERRFAIIDIAKHKAQNHAYFRAICEEYDNGGKEALLYFLLNYKINSNVRQIPITEGLHEHKVRSQPAEVRFFLEHLGRATSGPKYPRDELFEQYQKYTRNPYMSQGQFSVMMTKLLGEEGIWEKKRMSRTKDSVAPASWANMYKDIGAVRERVAVELFGASWVDIAESVGDVLGSDEEVEASVRNVPF